MLDVTTLTGGATATGVAILIGKELWSVIKAKMSNGNGNGSGSNKASVQVNVEPNKHDSTTGKRICDYHMEILTDTVEMKRDIKDLNGKCDKMDKEIGSITESQLNTHRKLDVILQHYGLSEFGRPMR